VDVVIGVLDPRRSQADRCESEQHAAGQNSEGGTKDGGKAFVEGIMIWSAHRDWSRNNRRG